MRIAGRNDRHRRDVRLIVLRGGAAPYLAGVQTPLSQAVMQIKELQAVELLDETLR